MTVRLAPLLLALAVLPAPALANGAFPDTAQVLLPADRPQVILLGTNFGLVISEDGGAHWRWTCEHGDAGGGYRYTLTGDQRRIVGLAGRALIASEDLGCSWTALVSADESIPFDFFPDADPAFALTLIEDLQTRLDTITRVDLGDPAGVPQVLYQAPMDEQLTTIESARADPRIIYATLNPTTSSGRTRIVHSMNGGHSWAVEPIEAPAEAVDLRIAAVDPRDPARIYFRAGTPLGQGEALVVSDDGGRTARSVFTTTGALAAFAPLAEGALLSVIDLGVGRLYRWDGATFSEVPAHISARGFAERGGIVYAATDNVADGFALARSRDAGRTWERVMGFGDISAISRCGELPGVCTATCAMLAMQGALQPAVCSSEAAPLDAAVHAAGDAGPDAGAPSGGSGCSCRAGSTTTTTTTTATAFFLVLLLRRVRGGRRPS
jgi:hypothetical protein